MAEQQSRPLPGEALQPEADEGGVFFVSMQYKGAAYAIPVQAEDPVASIFDFAQEALDFPRENCKLISRGKMLRPDHDALSVAEAGLATGSKLMLVASSAHDVSFVRSSRPDPLVKGFAEEERDELSRRKRARAAAASAWGTKQDAEYRFASIKAEFKYSEPPPYEAERLLQKLSTDPGIIDIMKTRKFNVGILTEMSPTEAQERMAKRGTPNMDLLGYNQNAGEMIVLRLRTDSLKGFRPYHDLINTLIHEMTHNVWGPHDHNFWALYGELKAQYMRFHRFWSHSGRAADSSSSAQFQGFVDADEEKPGSDGFGQVLGTGDGDAGAGNIQSLAASAAEARHRESAEAAAEVRFKEASEAAAAEAAASAAAGSSSGSSLPNFLAGNGSWIFVCPCGQVHNFEGMCDAGAAVGAESGAPMAGTEAADSGQDGLPAQTLPPPPVESHEEREVASTDAEITEEAAAGVVSASNVMSVDAAAVEGPAEAVQEVPQPTEPSEAAVDVIMDEPSQIAVTQDDGPPPLDVAELAEHGLDGAALWLHRFEGQLLALLGTPPGRPGAREAMALLLRMVRNVMDSPYDQKFRRIRADNPRVRASLLAAGVEAETLITMLGFEAVSESGERVFVLRDAVFDSARLRLGQELLERELQSSATSVK